MGIQPRGGEPFSGCLTQVGGAQSSKSYFRKIRHSVGKELGSDRIAQAEECPKNVLELLKEQLTRNSDHRGTG